MFCTARGLLWLQLPLLREAAWSGAQPSPSCGKVSSGHLHPNPAPGVCLATDRCTALLWRWEFQVFLTPGKALLSEVLKPEKWALVPVASDKYQYLKGVLNVLWQQFGKAQSCHRGNRLPSTVAFSSDPAAKWGIQQGEAPTEPSEGQWPGLQLCAMCVWRLTVLPLAGCQEPSLLSRYFS